MRNLHAPVKAVLLAAVLALCSPIGHAAPHQPAAKQEAAQATAPPATLRIEGAVPTPLTLTAEDLAKLPRATATLTSDGGTTAYEGVLLYDLLAKAGWQFGRGMTGKPMASYIVATARDGYQVVFAIAEIDPLFAGEKVLIADKADGTQLPGREQPFRVVVPGDKMHARSIYSVVKIEVVRLRP
jgi:DMSO/TMAO reductase YedYZ molybdopterin-dependent catalytic subunit